jgi:hypothetical protein
MLCGECLLNIPQSALRETRRERRSQSAKKTHTKRLRGVRRWAVSVDGRFTTQSGVAGDLQCPSPPLLMQQLVQWLLTSLEQLVVVVGDDHEFRTHLQQWKSMSSVDVISNALSPDCDKWYLPLTSLIWHTIHLMQKLPAHTSRSETLQWLFTATVWHLAGFHMAKAYVQNVMFPTLIETTICGIQNISHITVHYDARNHEWYISTEGSNFVDLCMAGGGPLHLCRRRCITTNIPEILSCLGLEAVCWMFSNGSLASSLGVSNASCRLLVDHMASRGLWRGVNRTSILSLSGTLNALYNDDAPPSRLCFCFFHVCFVCSFMNTLLPCK